MMSFGFATVGDAMSWAVALLLGAKLGATMALLTVRLERAEPALWWTTKLTPIAAMPLVIALAVRAQDRESVTIFATMAVFVAIAVPWAVRRRYATPRSTG